MTTPATTTPNEYEAAKARKAALIEQATSTNPLVAALVATGWEVRGDSVMVGSYYMSNANDDLLLVHPMNTGLARSTFPVEVIA